MFDNVKVSINQRLLQIDLETHEVKIERVNFGKFKACVKIGLDSRSMSATMQPFDKIGYKSPSGHFHPHVQPGGNMCVGDGPGLVSDALVRGNINAMFGHLYSMIHDYNPGSPYCNIEKWAHNM